MKQKEQAVSKDLKSNKSRASLAASILAAALSTLIVACGSDGFGDPPVPAGNHAEFLDEQDRRPTEREDFDAFENREDSPHDDSEPHEEWISDDGDDDDFPSEPEDSDWEDFDAFENREDFPHDDAEPRGEWISDDDDDFPSEPEDFDWEEDRDDFNEDEPFSPFD